MRDYLKSFFEEFEYNTADRVTLALAYEKIIECTAARERFTALISGYERDVKAISDESVKDIDTISSKSGVHTYTVALLAVICMSRAMRTRLARLGVSKRIITQTLFDFKWKCDRCRSVHGITGTDSFTWHVRFLELKIFGIGRLQFELKQFPYEDYTNGDKCIKQGAPVLYVHIPDDGTQLEEKYCNAAYRDAKKFFCSLLGVKNIPFVCNSWLLFPKNTEYLPPKSNIVKFMSKYDIFKVEYCRKDRIGSILFIFGVKPETEFSALPEKTSLQRAYKKHLLEGGRMGNGIGVFFLEEAEKKPIQTKE